MAPRLEVAPGPITVVMNAGSGSTDKAAARKTLEEVFSAAGRRHRIVGPTKGESMTALCERVAEEAAREHGVLVAAGGDGTVSAVAHAARKHDVAFGVLPLGTFNYFARDHGVPTEVEPAVRALVDGRITPVSAGEINGRLFINNASIGLYTELIRRRERDKAKFGRRRLVAALSAAGALLRGQRSFSIHLVDQAGSTEVRTSMLFASCNALQLEALGLGIADCSRAGSLGVVQMKPTGLAERLRLIGRALLKNLDEDPALESFCASGFEVRSRRRSVNVVVDGELMRMRTPLVFKALTDSLKLVVPRESPEKQ